MNRSLEIHFQSGDGYLGTFEDLAVRYYESSVLAESMIFDLSRVSFVGSYALMMLFSWISFLIIQKGKAVTIRLPQHAAQPEKMLVRGGLPEI